MSACFSGEKTALLQSERARCCASESLAVMMRQRCCAMRQRNAEVWASGALVLMGLMVAVGVGARELQFGHVKVQSAQLNLRLRDAEAQGSAGSALTAWGERRPRPPGETGPPLKVFHLHTPKTGGKSLRLSLPDIAEMPHSRHPPCCVPEKGLQMATTAFRTRQDMPFYSFEMPIGPMFRRLPPDTVIVALVREPLSHVMSQVGHIMFHGVVPSVSAWVERARQGAFVHYNSSNMQTTYLGGLHAHENLDRIVVGLTDYLPESICVFVHAMGTFSDEQFQELCGCETRKGLLKAMHHGNQNISSPLATLSIADMKVMRSITDADLTLYHLASAKFLDRVDAIRDATGVNIICSHRRRALAETREFHRRILSVGKEQEEKGEG